MATAKKRRTKGSGSIVKRGKVYYLVIKEDGKVVSKKSLRTGDRKTAEQKAEELLPNFDLKTKEEFVAKVAEIRRLKSQDKVKLSQAWEMFYTSKFRRQQTAEGTLGNYKRNYERFLGWLNRNYPTCKTLSEITLKIAEEYAQDVEDMIISNSTYNYHIRGMATITNVLMHDAGISENVWERIPRKPNDSIGKKAFTEEEVGRLLEAFDDESLKLMYKEQMKILFCIALFTGMRLADCALLLWRDIDLKSGMISLMPVKTKGSRKRITAPLSPAFREKLQEAADSWGMDGYVIPAVAERYQQNASGVSDDIQKVISFIGLETNIEPEVGLSRKRKAVQYGFHSFRHTFCSHSASNGMPVALLSEITGDSIATLQKYYVKIQHQALHKAATAIPGLPVTAKEVSQEQPAPKHAIKENLLAELQNATDLTDREKMLLALLKEK